LVKLQKEMKAYKAEMDVLKQELKNKEDEVKILKQDK